MKTKKTPTDKRGTYKLYDENGNLVTEYKPGVDDVTEVDIVMLHKMDDHEVYINSKEMKLPEWYQPIYKEWKEKFISDFTEKYGRKPYVDEIPGGHRTLESVDFTMGENDEEFGDKSYLQEKLAVRDESNESEAVECLKEIVEDMPENWQRVYELVLIEGVSKAEAGRILKISDVRVGQLVRRIKKEIADDKKLKKFFN